MMPLMCPTLCPPTARSSNFPAVAQRVGVEDMSVDGDFVGALPIAFPFGWMRLDFFHFNGAVDRAQAWIGAELESAGRFSLGSVATPLESACSAAPGGL